MRGKRNKKDVMSFQAKLSDNIAQLHVAMANKTYEHGGYSAFNISDPKPRVIHKASVRDRLLHHLIHKKIYPYFNERFIFDSYSCRKNKGPHRATARFKQFAGKVSKNNTKTCWVLKCDVKKFFASINHEVLLKIIGRHIEDEEIRNLIRKIVSSFCSGQGGTGLPLGNITSQLFANTYLHEFDMYMKQELRVKYYIRYADDFVVLSDSKNYLEDILPKIQDFLGAKLKLSIHPDKVYIKTYASGVDFLGWIHFPRYRRIRTSTKRKVLRKLKGYPTPETINSYRGLLGHGSTWKIRKRIAAFMEK